MCDPTGVSYVAIASAVIGAATTAYAAHQQGQAQEAAANYQAAVARNNQMLADQAAADAIKRGEVEANLQRQRTAAFKGRQRTALAASGQVVDTGSALDVTSDTDQIGKFEELRIRNNAAREALGYQTEGMNYAAQAGLNRIEASSARQAGRIGAFSSLVSGAGSVAGKWYNYKKGGAF